MYYTSLTGFPLLYLQCGNITCDIIGVNGFDPSVFHTIVINYNGNGMGSAANWKIVISGTNRTVTHTTNSGGGGTNVDIGGHYGQWAEIFCAQEQVLGGRLKNLLHYYKQRYGL